MKRKSIIVDYQTWFKLTQIAMVEDKTMKDLMREITDCLYSEKEIGRKVAALSAMKL